MAGMRVWSCLRTSECGVRVRGVGRPESRRAAGPIDRTYEAELIVDGDRQDCEACHGLVMTCRKPKISMQRGRRRTARLLAPLYL